MDGRKVSLYRNEGMRESFFGIEMKGWWKVSYNRNDRMGGRFLT
jgi:hypothetical protein